MHIDRNLYLSLAFNQLNSWLANHQLSILINRILPEKPTFPHPFSKAFLEQQDSLPPSKHPDTGSCYDLFKFLFNITLLSRPKTDVHFFQGFLPNIL